MTDAAGRSGPETDFLSGMAAASRARLDAARTGCSSAALRERIASQPAPPGLRLSSDGFDLVAEIKKRSPSAGTLAAARLSVPEQAARYRDGGAVALSVLTEPDRFGGALEDLTEAAAVAGKIPVMRKDFLVGPYQVLEARAAGAGGVLLIAAILDRPTLRDMLQLTLELDMFALVEAFDPDDLDHCVPVVQDCGPAAGERGCRLMIGVNCRNLRTLAIDFSRFAELVASLPTEIPGVAESGVETPEQAGELASLGYRLALVGSALMRSTDPETSVRALLAAGRQAVS